MIARIWSFLWVCPAIVVSTAGHGMVSYVISRFSKNPNRQLNVARAWARSLLWVVGVKVEVEGLEHVHPHGSYVFASNHLSYMDIPTILPHIPVEFLFMAKSGLFGIPFLGTHLKTAGHISVELDEPRAALKIMAQAAELIRHGRSTLVFPEGGRSEKGVLRGFKDGAAYLAIRAQVPIVPMALIGIREVLPMHSLVFHPARVKLRIGEPISTEGLKTRDRAALTETLRERVVALLAGEGRPGGDKRRDESRRGEHKCSRHNSTVIIGIDLGTTNCALAYSAGEQVELFAIPQLVHEGEERAEPLLPSFLFLDPAGPIVGVLAQRKGLENAGRLVTSAKSWLSHAGADRNGAILPPNAPEGVARVSPVEASRRYLEHLRTAWDAQHREAPFAAQQVLVTVPASFDEVARELTLQAAAQAGYPEVILLEEPQAAFYNWIDRHPDWRERVGPGDLILVIDIGGGTTDFSLIAVKDQAGELVLERIAVGDHILLGGDNVDAALAHHTAQGLPKLDAMRFHALWQQCRAAKEALLADDKAEHPITILGRGSGVVGGTIKTKLKRADLEQILLEGFLPQVAADAEPEGERAALAEFGLPFAPDAAITRHLAHFLKRQEATPTHVLFNGGVLQSALVRDRLLEVLNSWLQKPVEALAADDLMHAVARGAAYYGLARQGRGVRVRGGVPRSYYIGIETAMPAVPGMKPPVRALTVVPFGMEEGTGHVLREREFSLTVGQRASFRFLQSVERKKDAAGDMIDEIGPEMEEMSPVEVTLTGETKERVPVTLESKVTETGVLELWFVGRDGRRWKLEFNVRPRREK